MRDQLIFSVLLVAGLGLMSLWGVSRTPPPAPPPATTTAATAPVQGPQSTATGAGRMPAVTTPLRIGRTAATLDSREQPFRLTLDYESTGTPDAKADYVWYLQQGGGATFRYLAIPLPLDAQPRGTLTATAQGFLPDAPITSHVAVRTTDTAPGSVDGHRYEPLDAGTVLRPTPP